MISLSPQALLLTNEVLATKVGGNSDSDEVSMDVTGVNISTTFHRHCMHSHCLAANCSSQWQ